MIFRPYGYWFCLWKGIRLLLGITGLMVLGHGYEMAILVFGLAMLAEAFTGFNRLW